MTMKEKYDQFCKDFPLQTIQLSNCTFQYRYYKHPDPDKNVTIVPLVGGTGCGEGMFYMFEYFMPKYNVVCFNYPMEAKDNEQTAKAIAEFIQKVKLTNVYLMGQSYGGLLAQIIAQKYPNVVKGLILSGTAPLCTDGITFEGMSCISKMLDEKKVQKNLKTDKMIPLNLLFPFMNLMVKKAVPDKEMRQLFLDIFEVCKPSMRNDYFYHMDVLLADLRNYFGTQTKEDFLKFDHEVILFFSKEDTIFTEDLKQILCDTMSNPIVIDDLKGGHLALMKDLDRYLNEVNQFISRQNENYGRIY